GQATPQRGFGPTVLERLGEGVGPHRDAAESGPLSRVDELREPRVHQVGAAQANLGDDDSHTCRLEAASGLGPLSPAPGPGPASGVRPLSPAPGSGPGSGVRPLSPAPGPGSGRRQSMRIGPGNGRSAGPIRSRGPALVDGPCPGVPCQIY